MKTTSTKTHKMTSVKAGNNHSKFQLRRVLPHKFRNNISFVLILSLLFISTFASAQTITISGFVKDASSGEVLIGANIVEVGSYNGVSTDYSGFFSLSADSTGSIKISFVGYTSKTLKVSEFNGTKTIQLQEGEQIDEVVVEALKKEQFNIVSLSNKQLKGIPSLGGKPDVAKSLQLLPGIGMLTEGSSLMSVRGGDPGQNLYLFDNVPITYVNHIGGFMSVFNPDIINGIDVYKGGFHPRYGGRLSSIVDITQKEGNASEKKGSLSIGVTDASFHWEGPFKKLKNSTFIVAGRKTLIEPLFLLGSGLSDGNGAFLAYGFYDFNGKFTYRPNEKSTFSLNTYIGDDFLRYRSKDKSTYNTSGSELREMHRLKSTWGNHLYSGTWKQVHTNKLISQSTLSYTRYRLNNFFESLVESRLDTLKSSIYHVSAVQCARLHSALKYHASNNVLLEVGLENSLNIHMPNYSDSIRRLSAYRDYKETSNEASLFANGTVSFLKWSEVSAGLRASYFTDGSDSYFYAEPRVIGRLGLSKNFALTSSFMQTYQHSHLVFTMGEFLNNEVWIPSVDGIKPAFSQQYTFGFTANLFNGAYSLTADVYQKTMDNLIAYKEGYKSMSGDESWRTKIETGGSGTSEGIELLIKKNTGRVTGFASYTFMNSKRTYLNINEGKEFSFDFERPHNASISINYKLGKKWDFNASWVFQSGVPYTPVLGRQMVPSLEEEYGGDYYYYEELLYGDKNSARMANYHRLDLGFTYKKTTKRGRDAEWNFSLYNAYNRLNAVYYYYNTNKTGEFYNADEIGFAHLKQYKLSLFPAIPSVSYKVYFTKREDSQKIKEPFGKRFMDWMQYK